LGLPRPFDQQWSLRMQQILAYETDLLDYDDLFDGNPAIDRKVAELKSQALEELAHIDAMGGAVAAIAYMKSRLVEANSDRLAKIESGETTVVGVNRFTTTEPSPLTTGDSLIMQSDPKAEADQIARLTQWRTQRDPAQVATTLAALRQAATSGQNIMPASIQCAKAGVTTGEWAAAMRALYGEYRAPTGVSQHPSNRTEGLEPVRDAVAQVATKLGRPLRLLLGKPGLDGHSNGAEQIAARARDCGIEITYDGIRLTPQEIVQAATDRQPDVIGLSILSGSHLPLIHETLQLLANAGLSGTPLVVGGIIPDDDAKALTAMGVARVYTPKDFQLNRIMLDLVALADPTPVAAE
jgi:(2R)-ethylmalonyl-CoA mutase